MAFNNGLNDSDDVFKRSAWDDSATSCTNLVGCHPVTSEFMWSECVHKALSSTRVCFTTIC